MEFHEYSKFIAQKCHQMTNLPKLAYVFSLDLDMTYFNFGETVADNRGAYVKVFNNLLSAINWLKNN